MLDQVFSFLDSIDEALWSYLCIPLMIVLGGLFSMRFRFVQIFKFSSVLRVFFEAAREKRGSTKGVHPISAFFASIGGCIGIGNLVAVCTAIQIGGPGAIFWMWVAATLGMTIKYAEVYLGGIYRRPNAGGGYDGGPMYFLQTVFRGPLIPIIVALLLCVYGTEIYMFKVVTHSVVENWHVNEYLVISLLLFLVVYVGSGGIDRVGKITSVIIPIFLVLFATMSLWVLVQHIHEWPKMFLTIFSSAFTGHAAVGGFAGSGMLLTMSQGVARGCYTGDIGVGYASIVQAETSCTDPKRQAQLAILGIFLDTFVVCTLSTLLIMVTGVWKLDIPASLMVQQALSLYFPYMELYMPIFLFILGYSSLIAFFCVGIKCARFIHKKRGPLLYYLYAGSSFLLFSFVDQRYALTIMSITGALLLAINLTGMYRLKERVEAF